MSIFLGDDTWELLFPAHFNVSLPFDSFNTMDLDTVDDGIEKSLWGLLQQYEGRWDLFVTHFLGVDHIGHTHHAHHPLMQERLLRMDKAVKKVIENLSEDALLLLYGDHGMTDDGNHGGATREETDAALVVYSRGGGLRTNSTSGTLLPPIVSQIDLVPTLSLLLGLPVPFSSLGQPIPALFPGETALAEARLTTSLQVMRYLRAYGTSTGSLQEKDLAEAASVLEEGMRLHREGDLGGAGGRYQEFLSDAQQLGRGMFTQFNVPLMVVGLLLQTMALRARCASAPWAGGLYFSVKAGRGRSTAGHYCAGAVALGLLHALAGISDNCVKQEHWLVLLSGHVLFYLALQAAPRGPSERWRLAFLGLLSLWGAWLCSTQHRTETSSLSGGNNAIINAICAAMASSAGQVAGQAAFCLTAWAALLHVNYPDKGKWAIPGLLVSINSATTAGAVLVHSSPLAWEVFALSLSQLGLTLEASLVRVLAARVCLASSLLGLALALLCMRNQQYYATLTYHLALAVVLVTGESAAIAVALLAVHLYCVHRAIRPHLAPAPPTTGNRKGKDKDEDKDKKGEEGRGSLHELALVGFALHAAGLARLLFFCSQHRLDFGSLQLEAGFVGLPYFHFYWAGAMLALNTFGPDLLALLALYTAVESAGGAGADRRTAAGAVSLYRQVLVFVSCLTALVLRRHLMVWALFAPKLAFEASMWAALAPWLMT